MRVRKVHSAESPECSRSDSWGFLNQRNFGLGSLQGLSSPTSFFNDEVVHSLAPTATCGRALHRSYVCEELPLIFKPAAS